MRHALLVQRVEKPAEAGSAGSPREGCASPRHPKARPVDPPKQTVDAEND